MLQLGASLSHDEMAAFLRARVANWWIPDELEVVEALPRTGVGKVDKKVLRTWRDG